MISLEEERKKREEAYFKVTHISKDDYPIEQAVKDVASGNTVMYDAEDFVIINAKAISSGQIMMVPRKKPTFSEGIPFCGNCNRVLSTDDKYCRMCGNMIDWEEDSDD